MLMLHFLTSVAVDVAMAVPVAVAVTCVISVAVAVGVTMAVDVTVKCCYLFVLLLFQSLLLLL